MRHIAAKFVPRLLSNDQKEHRIAVCSEVKERTKNDPNFISTIITGDESWVYGYDPETKHQSFQ
jgi:histone-lysine N-methyltransferase SETMAR